VGLLFSFFFFFHTGTELLFRKDQHGVIERGNIETNSFQTPNASPTSPARSQFQSFLSAIFLQSCSIVKPDLGTPAVRPDGACAS
jgi:hypothetical protein